MNDFEYFEDGFAFTFNSGPKRFKWTDINELIAYKLDKLTIDEVCLDIVYGDHYFSINEEMPGWQQFVATTKAIFPSIPKNWDTNITQPPFAINLTVLYKKEG